MMKPLLRTASCEDHRHARARRCHPSAGETSVNRPSSSQGKVHDEQAPTGTRSRLPRHFLLRGRAGGRFAVRIGHAGPEADALAAAPELLPGPASRRTTPVRSRRAARQRGAAMRTGTGGYGDGISFLRRRGTGRRRRPDAGADSVRNVVGSAAAALGRRFGQAAVVIGERGAGPIGVDRRPLIRGAGVRRRTPAVVATASPAAATRSSSASG